MSLTESEIHTSKFYFRFIYDENQARVFSPPSRQKHASIFQMTSHCYQTCVVRHLTHRSSSHTKIQLLSRAETPQIQREIRELFRVSHVLTWTLAEMTVMPEPRFLLSLYFFLSIFFFFYFLPKIFNIKGLLDCRTTWKHSYIKIYTKTFFNY